MFKCQKCTNPSPSLVSWKLKDIIIFLVTSFLFSIKCPKCNQYTPSTSMFMITIMIISFFLVISIFPSSKNSSQIFSSNACDGVAGQISRYIQYPQRNSDINALENYYNQAKDMSRNFNSDPSYYTNYCASIMNSAAKAFLP